MSNKVSFGSTVTLAEAASVILACPKNRVILEGEPGIGKSTLLTMLGKALPDHNLAYIDVPNMDLGDTSMPVIDHDNRVCNYFPNARFRLTEDKPVIIMLDEFTKGMAPVKNMLHPLLEESNPRLGDITLHPDSYVFLTGNLSSDGVGDNLAAHSANRLTRLLVSKPTAEEWITWALNSGEVDPAVLAFVDKYPDVLESYLNEGQKENKYIFQPRAMQQAYASPRSLVKASRYVTDRHLLPNENTLTAALIGTVGQATARDLQAFVAYQDQLPTWDAIIKQPDTAVVPTSPGACSVLVYGAVTKIDDATIKPFMKYIGRFQEEWQAAFAINVAKNPNKQKVAFTSDAFRNWVLENEDLL